MGSIGTLVIGVVLICGVLFLGYKMDTSSSRGVEKKAPKLPKQKAPKPKKEKTKVFDIEEANSEDDGSDMPYESDDDFYEHDDVNQEDLVEDSEYEDEDVSLFTTSNNVQSSFNNDVDDEISFDEENEEVSDSVEPVQEDEDSEDFSSTMIFDTDKINNELEEIDKMDEISYVPHKAKENVEEIVDEIPEIEEVSEEEEEYSDPILDFDEKLKALDDDEVEPAVKDLLKTKEEDAESFMNKIKKMQETETADDFNGFVVEKADKELKETHKRYTKKKENKLPEIEVEPLSFDTPVEVEENIEPQVDINFLAQMEENLKKNQKERLSKSKTTKKSTEKTAEKTTKKTTKKSDK
jgi:hypothetical protein